MAPSATNALSALTGRLRQRGLWTGALLVPGLGIPVLVAFARPGEGPQALEGSLWLLATVPFAFASPCPWQWTPRPGGLAPWRRALLLAVAAGLLLAALSTVAVLAAAYPLEDFPRLFTLRIPWALGLGAPLATGLGWSMAFLERLRAQARAADEAARTYAWMRRRTPFPPGLLVSHLRRLSATAERQPVSTEEGIVRLAVFYRAWLALSDRPAVPLRAERELVEAYFQAEETRLGEPIAATWEGWEAWGERTLPTFALFDLCADWVASGIRELAFRAAPHERNVRLHITGRTKAGAVEPREASATLSLPLPGEAP